MDHYLNLSAGLFAFLFSFSIFLILSSASVDAQITSILLTIGSIFLAVGIFIASVVSDIKSRKARELEEDQ